MQQIIDNSLSDKIPAVLQLAFRIFFLSGSLFCLIALLLWSTALFHDIGFVPYSGSYWWHSHEMVFGFSAAIIAGFLLTAVQNWTGIPSIKGTKLLLLFLLWISARILFIFPNLVPNIVIAILDVAFFPMVAITLAYPVIKIQQWRNLVFVPVLLLFATENALFHYAVINEQLLLQRNVLWASVFTVVLLVSIIGSRVIPFFTARGTGKEPKAKLLWLELLANSGIALLVFYYLFGKPIVINDTIIITILAVTLITQLIRQSRWNIIYSFKEPLLWSLHLSFLFIPIGIVLLLLNRLGLTISESHALHSFTVGTISGMILAMMARVSLGHTGRQLATVSPMATAFALMILAALVRSPISTLDIISATMSLSLSIGCFILAYGIFLWRYIPILSKPRIDGRPG